MPEAAMRLGDPVGRKPHPLRRACRAVAGPLR
jgi:hypothetical protein